jgi:hypothetical protein
MDQPMALPTKPPCPAKGVAPPKMKIARLDSNSYFRFKHSGPLGTPQTRGIGIRRTPNSELRTIIRFSISVLSLTVCLLLGGCLPPKTIIALPETPQSGRPPSTAPLEKSLSEEQRKIEQLIQQLEKTEQRLLETHRQTEETLQKVEKAALKTEEAAGRIQKAQEKIEVIGQKDNP